MQYKIRLYVLFALIIALGFTYYQSQRYESLANLLFEENTKLKKNLEKDDTQPKDDDLRQKVKSLEDENKLLKEQIYQLEHQQFLFKSDQNDNTKYNIEDNLKFKDDTKNLKEFKENKKDEDYKITPSVDIDTEKKEIDGLKLKIETKF